MRCMSIAQLEIEVDRGSVTHRSRDVSSPSSPVDVDVLALLVLLVGELWLDPEGVCTKVITLRLEKVGGEVLGAVTVVEAESSAERRSWDTPESTLGDDTIPKSAKC